MSIFTLSLVLISFFFCYCQDDIAVGFNWLSPYVNIWIIFVSLTILWPISGEWVSGPNILLILPQINEKEAKLRVSQAEVSRQQQSLIREPLGTKVWQRQWPSPKYLTLRWERQIHKSAPSATARKSSEYVEPAHPYNRENNGL